MYFVTTLYTHERRYSARSGYRLFYVLILIVQFIGTDWFIVDSEELVNHDPKWGLIRQENNIKSCEYNDNVWKG